MEPLALPPIPDLLSRLSHAMAAPVIVGRAAVEGLRERYPDDEDVAVLERMSQRADVILDGVVRIQAVEHPRTVEAVDLDVLARATLRRVGLPPSGPHGATGAVLADRCQVAELLRELLANAVVHAGPNAAVGVRTSRHGDRMRLEITDDGPGLPDTVHRTDPRPFTPGGPWGQSAGCGLAIAFGLARVNGGHVTLSDHPPGGLQVVVELPAAP